MPQTFLVVQWQCKLCGEKQSLQRVYARSHSAKDCRLVVQHYNAARGDILEDEDAERAQAAAYGSAEAAGGGNGDSGGEQCLPQQQRWQAFKDEGDEDEGWTIAVPQRAAAVKLKCSGGQAGGGSKRRREQQDQAWGAWADAADDW
ncbi:hypothetical protein CHLNCDRAFT_145281 [Chlorella variabilis]|uniref:MRN complex-interacting protein N-terminal domain-containing protein n=1 Tax=Chlorella variabilis TaxID=554065 RepID=E1ZE37_CHLVA|nr:hypothetical protein CHLNCDRAFT_145281 [Chlorella variabilis]EFN55964.1 hypothetical protein CHLNCDRAFT_145281 [Chlorella variabilis]|eukprot:XP_005848066.1 hypothetical protein CHLNCDRAFT_145281 [Chlorella variabilis]